MLICKPEHFTNQILQAEGDFAQHEITQHQITAATGSKLENIVFEGENSNYSIALVLSRNSVFFQTEGISIIFDIDAERPFDWLASNIFTNTDAVVGSIRSATQSIVIGSYAETMKELLRVIEDTPQFEPIVDDAIILCEQQKDICADDVVKNVKAAIVNSAMKAEFSQQATETCIRDIDFAFETTEIFRWVLVSIATILEAYGRKVNGFDEMKQAATA